MFTAEELAETLSLILTAPAQTLGGAYQYRPVFDRLAVLQAGVANGKTVDLLDPAEVEVIRALRESKAAAQS